MRFLPRMFTGPEQVQTRHEWMAERPSRLYHVLEAYYDQNDLYENVKAALWERDIWTPAMKGLRNPANRVVEFYAAKLWPGTLPDALPIKTENDTIKEPIEQVWTWSNWAVQKQVAARRLAMLGDLFIKVAQHDDRRDVYFQLIDPAHVIEFDVDVRGYITYIRIDIPQVRRKGDKLEEYTLTEVWDANEQTFRRWEHENAVDTDTSKLGRPVEDLALSAFGVDFVPIVHAKHRDTGKLRGEGAFTHALDKIDEANRQATRLHQMLFRENKSTWVLSASGIDADGRPLPPPSVGSDRTTAANTVTIGDDELWRLPGNTTLTSMVPQVNWRAALDVLQDQMNEIEHDLPELAYYRLRDMNQVSGIAVRMLLSDAIDRLLEARGNAEAALVRANQMALTMGAKAGLFPGLSGTYEDGSFDHEFEERDVISLTPAEESDEQKSQVETLLLKKSLGVSNKQALDELGYEEEQITEMLAEQEMERDRAAERAQQRFGRGLLGVEDE